MWPSAPHRRIGCLLVRPITLDERERFDDTLAQISAGHSPLTSLFVHTVFS